MPKKKDITEMTLGKRLELLRKSKNLTLVDLGKIAGVSHGQILNYESDKQVPNAVAIYEISKALETTVEYLLTGETSKLELLGSRLKAIPSIDRDAILQVVEKAIWASEVQNKK
jgi:transcriptional regulator with XRE-family HTH domain